MRILMVNTFDRGGGAEAVVSRLRAAYGQAGHQAWLAVKRRRGLDDGVIPIPETAGHGALPRGLLALAEGLEGVSLPGGRAAGQVLRSLARPRSTLDRRAGREDFGYPSTRGLCSLPPAVPDVLHLHNLHGGYFDLTALPALSEARPVVWTLHDCWPFSGHCAHSFQCDRWRQGCGDCPDLGIYPAIRRDATGENWQRKKAVFERSRIFLATPSEWLMERARQSILWPAVREARVIHNGVDDAFFQAPGREEARRRLELPADHAILLFAANSIRENEWKDFRTLQRAVQVLGERGCGRPIQLIAVGEPGPDATVGEARLRFVPFEGDPARMALWFSAADLYLHAARVETFSLTIAEAMACGTAVVATEAGAVAERIVDLGRHGQQTATGILVANGDAAAMAEGAHRLLTDAGLAAMLGANARAEARRLYRLERQAAAYLDWFSRIKCP